MIRDKNISWKVKTEFHSVLTMTGQLNGTFLGTGGAVLAESSVSASEQVVALVGAAGDEYYDRFVVPFDYDYSEPLRYRIWYIHTTTDLDTPTWTFSYMGRAEGEAIADITSHNDTIYSGVVSATANAIGITDWVDTGSEAYIPTTDKLILTRLTATDLGGAGGDEFELLGVEYAYTIAATSTDNARKTTSYMGASD